MPSTFTADELNFCLLPLSASGTPSAGQRFARAEWEQVDPKAIITGMAPHNQTQQNKYGNKSLSELNPDICY